MVVVYKFKNYLTDFDDNFLEINEKYKHFILENSLNYVR